MDAGASRAGGLACEGCGTQGGRSRGGNCAGFGAGDGRGGLCGERLRRIVVAAEIGRRCACVVACVCLRRLLGCGWRLYLRFWGGSGWSCRCGSRACRGDVGAVHLDFERDGLHGYLAHEGLDCLAVLAHEVACGPFLLGCQTHDRAVERRGACPFEPSEEVVLPFGAHFVEHVGPEELGVLFEHLLVHALPPLRDLAEKAVSRLGQYVFLAVLHDEAGLGNLLQTPSCRGV